MICCGKIYTGEMNIIALERTLENSILKNGKKNEHYFLGETRKSLFLFLWNDDMSG